MSEDLSKFKKKRTAVRSSLTKLINKIEGKINNENEPVDQFEAFLEQLNDKESNLSLLNTLIEDLLSFDTITEDIEASEKIKEKIIFWKMKLSSKIRRINSDSIQVDTVSRNIQVIDSNSFELFHNEVLTEFLDDIPLAATQRLWFQYDGAPALFCAPIRDWLDIAYPGRWIGRRILWPPRLLNLIPLYFFLLGLFKELVYRDVVTTQMDLVARLYAACSLVDPAVPRHVMTAIPRRAQGPEAPKKSCIAPFRLLTGHDCLRSHIYGIGIADLPDRTLCDSGQPMITEHVDEYPGLINLNSAVERSHTYGIDIADSPDRTLCDSGQPMITEHVDEYPRLINLNFAVETCTNGANAIVVCGICKKHLWSLRCPRSHTYGIDIPDSPDRTLCDSGQPMITEHVDEYPRLINLNFAVETCTNGANAIVVCGICKKTSVVITLPKISYLRN
ncbi:uncharacterized protein TNCV_2439111 [Trichonephila clavipes]|nr:uncharacterized protein TNCV_2439111 [Trichonephila clavipes]